MQEVIAVLQKLNYKNELCQLTDQCHIWTHQCVYSNINLSKNKKQRKALMVEAQHNNQEEHCVCHIPKSSRKQKKY